MRHFIPYRPGSAPQAPTANSALVVHESHDSKDTLKSGLAATIKAVNLNVYPNPSTENFNVAASEGILNSNPELVLIDQLGREHQRRKLTSALTTISTKGMADGVYSIVVQYGNNRTTVRVAKVTE